jgi:hypothetical protein
LVVRVRDIQVTTGIEREAVGIKETRLGAGAVGRSILPGKTGERGNGSFGGDTTDDVV